MSISTEAKLKTEKFEAIALTHIDSLYRFALYLAKNESDAQCLVQDTYLNAYRFFDNFHEGTNCKVWLLTILKNTFVNTIRRDKKHPQMVCLSELEEHGSMGTRPCARTADAEPEDGVFGYLLDDDVAAAMDALPVVYRAIILLADVEGLSYKEIAEIVGCPIGTVMSGLCRGRRLLRKRLLGL